MTADDEDDDLGPEPAPQTRMQAVVEDAEYLVATNECWSLASHRLSYGSRTKSLERVLYRAGRGDLVSALKRNELNERERDLHRSTHRLAA